VAIAVATIAGLEIAIVALFSAVEDAVTAILNEQAGLSGLCTIIPGLNLAGASATVPGRHISVVTRFVRLNNAVATFRGSR
jgi:hypothetical protein